MDEKIKILVLEQNKEIFNALNIKLEALGVSATHVINALAAIGMLRTGKYQLVLMNVDPYFNPQGLRDIMTFLRFANRSGNIELGVFGEHISANKQLTLTDFSIKTFLKYPIDDAQLKSFVDKVLQSDGYISALKKREDDFGENYPLDVNHILRQSNNDANFIKLLFQSFVEEVPEYFSDLNESAQLKNQMKIGQLAHKIVAPLNIVGVKDFTQFVDVLETEMEKESPDWDLVSEQITALTGKFQNAYKEIRSLLDNVE